ncbi:hypothetical protein YPPY12_3226, partial [Yersinia pestis PY-12]
MLGSLADKRGWVPSL